MSETTEKYQTKNARERVAVETTDALAKTEYPQPEDLRGPEALDKTLLHLVRRINTTDTSNLMLYNAACLIASLNEIDRNALIAVAIEVLQDKEN